MGIPLIIIEKQTNIIPLSSLALVAFSTNDHMISIKNDAVNQLPLS